MALLSVIIGMILASAFPAIIVFAQELMPGKTDTVSGLFSGFHSASEQFHLPHSALWEIRSAIRSFLQSVPFCRCSG